MTYSIVARDPVTGDLGVAVQSHYFGVGRVVPWGQAGVGVVATQSIVDVSYGPQGLGLMVEGVPPADALQRLLAADAGAERRQVALMNVHGEVSTHTGSACIGAAGHAFGPCVSAQANLVESDSVWHAMIDAFAGALGDLGRRLLAALEAAEQCGGDIRGRQSSAMLVVRGVPTGDLALDRVIDLRVDDAEDPLAEMGRLLDRMQALGGLVALLEMPGLLSGPMTAAVDEVERALAELRHAQTVLGASNREPTVWCGLLLGRMGRDDEAVEAFRAAAAVDHRVTLLVSRLADAGLWNRSRADLGALIARVDAP